MASFRWPPTDQQQAVTGPASSTDNALVRWNGTAGTAVRNSPGTSLDDVGNLTVKSVTGSDLTASRLPVIDADKKLVHSAVTATEAGYLSGVTSAIQTQLTTNATAISTETTNRIADVDAEEARALAAESDLQDEIDAEELARASADTTLQTNINAKQDTITGAATTITGANLTTDRALTSNGSGKVAVSAVTSTELGYVSGVTSAIQTQLDAKIANSLLTTRGDLIRRGSSGPERFAAVTNNRVVRGDGTDVVLGQIDSPSFFTSGANATSSAPGTLNNRNSASTTVQASGESAAEDMTSHCTRLDRVVFCTFVPDSPITLAGTTLVFEGLIPSGFRPTTDVRVVAAYKDGTGYNTGIIYIQASDGRVEFFKTTAAGPWTAGNIFDSQPVQATWQIL
jgi:hypothetical protein